MDETLTKEPPEMIKSTQKTVGAGNDRASILQGLIISPAFINKNPEQTGVEWKSCHGVKKMGNEEDKSKIAGTRRSCIS